jgi:hypothetical protein
MHTQQKGDQRVVPVVPATVVPVVHATGLWEREWLCVCVHVYIHTCLCPCANRVTYLHRRNIITYIHTHIRTYIRVQVHVPMESHIYTGDISAHVCKYIYIHILTHTYIYIHTAGSRLKLGKFGKCASNSQNAVMLTVSFCLFCCACMYVCMVVVLHP